jgi:hypothetical protein
MMSSALMASFLILCAAIPQIHIVYLTIYYDGISASQSWQI